MKTRANKPINLPGPVSGSQAFALGAEAGSFVARHLRAVLSFDRPGRLSAESLDGELGLPCTGPCSRAWPLVKVSRATLMALERMPRVSA